MANHSLDDGNGVAEPESASTPEERRRILAARARALSGQRTRVEHRELVEVVCFRVGGERYAVPIDHVDEILEIRTLSPLVGAPHHILGAVVARSRVVAVLDLRAILGLHGGGMSDLIQVMVVSEGEELFGLAVEEVEGKLHLPAQSRPAALLGPFLWVAADRLAVLDVAQLAEPGAVAVAREG